MFLLTDGDLMKHVPIWVKDGKKRVRHDLYMSRRQRFFASLAERGYIDATYKLAPYGFMQVLTVKIFH